MSFLGHLGHFFLTKDKCFFLDILQLCQKCPFVRETCQLHHSESVRILACISVRAGMVLTDMRTSA